jgi:predicted deacylase
MPGHPDGAPAQVYAYRLVQRFLAHMDYFVDLHTASFGRINSLYVRADMTEPTTARMAYLQRPQIIVHNSPSDRTLRGTAMERGIPSITIEIGNPQRFHPGYIKSSVMGLRRLLSEVGLLAKRPVALGPPPILCRRSSWLRTDAGGLLTVIPDVAEFVAAGSVVGVLRNVFGDLVKEYVSPHHGVVVGKSVDPVSRTGDRILHLGLPMEVDGALHTGSTGEIAPQEEDEE